MIRLLFLISFIVFFSPQFLLGTLPDVSPFAIDFPAKENLTNDDYIEVQNQLRKIDIEPFLKTIYPHSPEYLPLDGFLWRITRGINQVLIDPEKGYFPEIIYEKIGKGGPNCIVTYASYNSLYPEYIRNIPDALKACGFNGYFLSMIGGFPNPTGHEIKFAGVPYSFKVFMILEAHKLGFDRILWVDSAMLPVNDPTPLFDHIETNGALFIGGPTSVTENISFLPQIRDFTKKITDVDVVDSGVIIGGILGFKMSSFKTQKFVKEFYRLVTYGTPFLSCFPEEFVTGAIVAKINHEDFYNLDIVGVVQNPWSYLDGVRVFNGGISEEIEDLEKVKNEGFYFFHRWRR